MCETLGLSFVRRMTRNIRCHRDTALTNLPMSRRATARLTPNLRLGLPVKAQWRLGPARSLGQCQALRFELPSPAEIGSVTGNATSCCRGLGSFNSRVDRKYGPRGPPAGGSEIRSQGPRSSGSLPHGCVRGHTKKAVLGIPITNPEIRKRGGVPTSPKCARRFYVESCNFVFAMSMYAICSVI